MWILLLCALSVYHKLVLADSGVARIVNGDETDISQIPYQCLLRHETASNVFSNHCGCVIIHQLAVLTAAHCVAGYDPLATRLQVVVGTSFTFQGGVSYQVENVYPHELYNPEIIENDIALIKTYNPIEYNFQVQPVKMSSRKYIIPEKMEAIVSGYGLTERNGPISSVLRSAKVYIVSHKECSKRYENISVITPNMICAAASNPMRDACQGDSGGPLVANGTLIGIVSWGEGCADENFPGVYTRVAKYFLWIKAKMSSFR